MVSVKLLMFLFTFTDTSSNQQCCPKAAQEVETSHQTQKSDGKGKLEKIAECKTNPLAYFF